MKCRICGANLKKEGDICSNCYKELMENKDLEKDKKEVLKVTRKYSIANELRKYTEFIIVFIICLVLFALGGVWSSFFLTLLIILLIFGFLFFFDKRKALATKAIFYEKKATYTFKLWFIDTKKTVRYSDITDVTYFQTFRQKKLGFGDICIYAKGSIPGKTLLNGFQIKEVENVEEVTQQIRNIIGTLDS